jgi:hypothetical protein
MMNQAHVCCGMTAADHVYWVCWLLRYPRDLQRVKVLDNLALLMQRNRDSKQQGKVEEEQQLVSLLYAFYIHYDAPVWCPLQSADLGPEQAASSLLMSVPCCFYCIGKNDNEHLWNLFFAGAASCDGQVLPRSDLGIRVFGRGKGIVHCWITMAGRRIR